MENERSYSTIAGVSPERSPGPNDAPPQPKMGKLVGTAVLATSLEWFDFIIYGTAAAIVLGPLFFPTMGGASGTLASFATLAVGFLARPIGGILAGHLGDRFGRKPPLVASLVLMGLSTFAIGVLPTYAAIGLWAPILLIAFRLLQGLGVGAQWGGVALLLTEFAPVKRRGFYGSFVQVGAIIGAMAGIAAFLVLTAAMDQDRFMSWGWRLPFIAGLFLVLIAMYVQNKIEDSPVFKQAQQHAGSETTKKPLPIVEVFRTHRKQVFQAAGSFLVANATYYIFITGMIGYGPTVGLTRSESLAAVLIAGSTQMLTLPLCGSLSDRIGRKKTYLFGVVAMALLAFPVFWMVNTGNVILAIVGLTLGFCAHALMFAPQAALFSEMFSAELRYSGASIGYQLASIFGGGLAPFIMTALLAWAGSSWAVSLYILGVAVITLVSVLSINERFQRDLSTRS
ncbi:MFS transporter [Rhodococcus rhodochrous]|uniref:MFS transporter n=1 Tax=Rhodococcus rhodochrous TaxID=1829 RepID=UPI000E773112